MIGGQGWWRPPWNGAERQCVIDGVGFDSITEEATLALITRALHDGRGGTVLTANVDILRQLRAPSLSKLASDAELVVADGMPVVLASRLMGQGLPERVTGSSLIHSLSTRVLHTGGTVALIGGAQGVVDRAAEALAQRTPVAEELSTTLPRSDSKIIQTRWSGSRGSSTDTSLTSHSSVSGSPSKSGSQTNCGRNFPQPGLSDAGAASPCWPARLREHRGGGRRWESSGSSDWRRNRSDCSGGTSLMISRMRAHYSSALVLTGSEAG